jgi:hypothetical protein
MIPKLRPLDLSLKTLKVAASPWVNISYLDKRTIDSSMRLMTDANDSTTMRKELSSRELRSTTVHL